MLKISVAWCIALKGITWMGGCAYFAKHVEFQIQLLRKVECRSPAWIFQVLRAKWTVCQIYFRRSKHSVDPTAIDHIFFTNETVRSAMVAGTFVYVLIAVVFKVGNDSLVMVPLLVRLVLGIQCVSRQVFD